MQNNDPYKFYDPLRNTLDKSSANWTEGYSRNIAPVHSIDKSAAISRLSKRRRDLSPQ